MITVKDVAHNSKTSVSTASIVLSGRGSERKISAATQNRVLEAATALNYKPNLSARRLRTGGPQIPIVIIYWAEDFRASMLVRFMRGLQKGMNEISRAFEFIIHFYKIDELNTVAGFLDNNLCNAAIICNASQKDLDFLDTLQVNLPVVLYNRHSKKYCTVNVDDYELGKKPALLFAARGHKTTSVLSAKAVFPGMDIRLNGFKDTLLSHNIEICLENIILSENSMKGGYDAACSLIEKGNLSSSLFCVSDYLAIGALKAFHKHNIKIPRDMEIISVGNAENDLEEYVTPSLTVVHVPVEKMAVSCIKLVHDIIDKRVNPPFSLSHEVDYIIRESCGGFY